MLSKTKPEPERLIAIDWSGRIDAVGQRKHIWAGIWTRAFDGKITLKLQAGRTRDEVADWLIALAAETPRMVVSIDCCFSYPAWFLEEHHCATVFDFWEHVASGQGELWLAREAVDIARDERFWGKPHKRPAEFSGANLRRMMRFTDWDNKIAQSLPGGNPARAIQMRGITPKSPFQIGGSGSVGTGSLRAMPFLLRLRDAGFRIWPFEAASPHKPLVVEMYTRLMTGPVAKSNPAARKQYLSARRKQDPLFASVPRSVSRTAEASEDAFDALISTLEMARHAAEFTTLKPTKDPVLRLEGITWRPGVR